MFVKFWYINGMFMKSNVDIIMSLWDFLVSTSFAIARFGDKNKGET